jgi:hypothetical protein
MAMSSRVSEAKLHPEWIRWVLPSASDLFFVALLGVLVFTALSVRLLGDAGIGWHIRTGQLILRTHSVPRFDSFSSSMSGQPWFAWEWLYDVVVGWLEGAAGLNGVVLFTASVIAATFALTFRMLLQRGTNILVAAMLVLLAASSAMIHFLARPHVLSWLFTVIWFWILESSEQSSIHSASHPSSEAPRSWRLWFLPSLTLGWANVHGGFLVGFALLAIYWIGAVWRPLKHRGDRFDEILAKIRAGQRLRMLTWIGVLSAAATFVNPYGYQLHIHIYQYLTNRFLMDRIDEFQSPNFHYVAQKCFAGLLLLTLIACASRRRADKRVSVTDGLILLFAVYSGLYASRNIPVSAILLAAIIGPWLSEATDRLGESRWAGVRERYRRLAGFLHRMQSMEFSLRGHLGAVAAILFACWVAAHGGQLGSTVLMNAHFDGKRFPIDATDYLEKQEATGPFFIPDDWGGYLIYRMYPRAKVVVDDRHDMYGEKFLRSYLTTIHIEPGWEDFLQQYPANFVIVPKKSALANLLAETTGWHLTYGDDVALVFVRVQDASQ